MVMQVVLGSSTGCGQDPSGLSKRMFIINKIHVDDIITMACFNDTL